jgi:hypothetical protein
MILLIQDEAQEVKRLAMRAAGEPGSPEAVALLAEGQAKLAGLVRHLAVAIWVQSSSAETGRHIGSDRHAEDGHAEDGRAEGPRTDA